MRISALHEYVEEKADKIDLCVADFPKRHFNNFKSVSDFKTQCQVSQVVDLSAGSPSAKKFYRKLKESERRIRKYELSYRVSHSDTDFEIFYYKMYVPHAQKQHGKYSVKLAYKQMEEVFKDGYLLLVIQAGIAIAGQLFSLRDGILSTFRMGILNGDRSYVEMGAISALYYFTVEYANSAFRFNRLDCGESLSFPDDGVFLNKREMGATVYPDNDSESWIFIFNPNQSDKISYVFESNPIIVHTDTGLMVLVGVPDMNELMVEERDRLKQKYHSPGIKGMILLKKNADTSKILFFDDPDNSRTIEG